MVTMPEELLHLLTEWHTVPVATVGPDGTPNVAQKIGHGHESQHHCLGRTLVHADV
jgi:hypothetical protein